MPNFARVLLNLLVVKVGEDVPGDGYQQVHRPKPHALRYLREGHQDRDEGVENGEIAHELHPRVQFKAKAALLFFGLTVVQLISLLHGNDKLLDFIL